MKRKFPVGYRSPFRHFLMPLRNVHRLKEVRQVIALVKVKIFRKDHYKSEAGDEIIVPLPLAQGTVRQVREQFYLASGAIDVDAVEGYFNVSPTAQYASLVKVLGIYFLKSESARRAVAKEITKKTGGFKKDRRKKK
jgi:hypothetical protein